MPQGGYGQFIAPGQQPMQAQPQYGGGIPQPAPQQGFQPTQQPAPAYPGQQGAYQQGGYVQQQPQGGYVQQPMQGGYNPQGMPPQQGAAQRGNVRQAPYYQPAQAPAPAPAQGIEDMPDFGA